MPRISVELTTNERRAWRLLAASRDETISVTVRKLAMAAVDQVRAAGAAGASRGRDRGGGAAGAATPECAGQRAAAVGMAAGRDGRGES